MSFLQLDADFIEKYWPLSNVELDEILQKFDDRITQGFHADVGRFVCKVLSHGSSYYKMEKRIFVFDFLSQRNFRAVPKLCQTRTGKNFQEIDGRFVIVLERIDGAHAAPTPENYRQLGDIMGQLNSIADYPNPALIPVDAIRPDFADLSLQLPDGMRIPYRALADSIPDIDSLPKSLIHFEMNLHANSIQQPNGNLVILDWDEAGTGARILDPGYMLISQFISEDCIFEQENAEAFYQAYARQVELSNREKSHLFDASLFHALRYIIWGNHEKRWERIQWALANRRLLEAVYR